MSEGGKLVVGCSCWSVDTQVTGNSDGVYCQFLFCHACLASLTIFMSVTSFIKSSRSSFLSSLQRMFGFLVPFMKPSCLSWRKVSRRWERSMFSGERVLVLLRALAVGE
jgi:hypothetical protein